MHILNEDEADNLGTGLRFTSRFDVETAAGSLDLVEGLDCLRRDLAYASSIELDTRRGDLPTDEFREEVRVAVRDTVKSDDRIDSIVGGIEVTLDETTSGAIDVELTVEAITGERGEFVLKIRP